MKRFGWIGLALAVVLGAYGWTAVATGALRPRAAPADYYGFLTDAITSGHLYLKLKPDPRLALLANPWAGYQDIPRLHDATYYHGRYYLYFGVTPVLLLLAPWHLLTHTFLTEGAAEVVFGLIGFLAGLDLLRRLVAQLPVPPARGWIAGGVLVWGLGNFAFALMQYPIFYHTAIMTAYACLMCALNAVGRSADAAQPAAAARWLATASLAWGLAVGARPDYLDGLPALGLPLLFLVRRSGGSWARGWKIGLTAAAGLPAMGVGLFLAWYNYARFGSPFEFGFHYQFTSESQQNWHVAWNPGSFGGHLFAYLFQNFRYSPYSPFLILQDGMVGIFAVMPVAALALAFPATLLDRRLRRAGSWPVAGGCALAAGCIHLFVLCNFPAVTLRYLTDCTPSFILVALASGALLVTTREYTSRPWHRALAAGIGVLGAVTVALSGLLALEWSSDHRAQRLFARLLYRPVAALESATGAGIGPLRIELSLDGLPLGQRAPLVETGSGTDFLFVERTDVGHVRFGFVHLGDPELIGAPVPFAGGSRHLVVADLGSLYPPDEHPALREWSQPLRDFLHRRVEVTLDGASVLQGASAFYASDPLHTYVGRDVAGGLTLARYPGEIYRVTHGGLPATRALENEGLMGPVRLHLRFPPFVHVMSEPLIASGARGASDLIYVTYLGRGRARFGHDTGGAIETREVAFDPDAEHTLEVDFAPLTAPRGALPDIREALKLRFDGRWLIAADRRTHPTLPFEVVFGYNSVGMSSARDSFSGTLLRAEPMAPLATPNHAGEGLGPLEISVRFPAAEPGTREPLAVTGRTGAGDLVYVIYEAGNRIRLGIDHWGIGGTVSNPIPISPARIYSIRISSAALFPRPNDPTWGKVPAADQDRIRAAIRVQFDGQPAVEAAFIAYPSRPSEIEVGENSIGGSSCGLRFSGDLVEVRRLGLPAAAP
jgi:hypothetical protein